MDFQLDSFILYLFIAALAATTVFVPLIFALWRTKPVLHPNPLFNYLRYIWLGIAFLFWLTIIERIGIFFAACTLMIAAIIALFDRSRFWQKLPSVLFAVAITTTFPWWRFSNEKLDLTLIETGFIIGLVLIITLMLELLGKAQISRPQITGLTGRMVKSISLGLVILVIAIFVFYPGVILGDALVVAWHHWSAYIGPARLSLSGAVLLHDIPVQYGIGPTVLTAAACKISNCWDGFYYVTAMLSLAFVIALGWIVARIT